MNWEGNMISRGKDESLAKLLALISWTWRPAVFLGTRIKYIVKENDTRNSYSVFFRNDLNISDWRVDTYLHGQSSWPSQDVCGHWFQLSRLFEGKVAVGKQATNFEAEIMAISEASVHLSFSDLNKIPAVFFTDKDSEAAVLAVCSPIPSDHSVVNRTKVETAKDKETVFQRFPSLWDTRQWNDRHPSQWCIKFAFFWRAYHLPTDNRF